MLQCIIYLGFFFKVGSLKKSILRILIVAIIIIVVVVLSICFTGIPTLRDSGSVKFKFINLHLLMCVD